MTRIKHETGVWTLDYPQDLKEAVLETAQRWAEFCLLPSDIQDIFTPDDMFNGSGFERKIGIGGASSRFSHDKKMNFDSTSQDIPALVAMLHKIDNPIHQQTARHFIESLAILSDEAPEVIEEFGNIIEKDFDVAEFHILAETSVPHAFFRCLYYPPTQSPDEIIGEAHVDNSGFTLHLFESTDGCEALASDKKHWYKMPVADGQALAFPSMQTQLYSEGTIDGLCHRILSNKTTQEFGRIAIVCFVALKGIPAYDRAKFGRLQEKTPGFNYGMSPDEFEQLFVK